MSIKRRHLPSLKSLATFEIAAKHSSFTLAAKELNVTQAAVSQHIRYLEEILELSLFNRGKNTIELTEEGEELLRHVSKGLDRISDGISTIKNHHIQKSITIATTNAAAQLWLYPLIEKYEILSADTKISLLASDRDDSIQNFTEVDIAMLCGSDRSKSSEKLIPLFTEVVKPVCSPQFFSNNGPLQSAESLLSLPLLHLHKRHWTANMIDWPPVTWQKWFNEQQLMIEGELPGFQTNSYVLLNEICKKGKGIMLGFQHLTEAALREGSLQIAFDATLASGRHFYFEKRLKSHSDSHIDDFIEFVCAEIKTMDKWT